MKNRNRYFLNYINKYNCDYRIVKDNMDNDTAYQYEKELICKYKEMGYCKTNIAEGGKGGARLFGELNPMFGRTWWDDDTPYEKIEQWKSNVACKGEKNGMFGVSPKERMDVDTYNQWIYKHKQITGENNPNYGNKKLSIKYKQNPELALEKQSRPGKKNGRCRPVRLFNDKMEFIKDFDYIKECSVYIKENNNLKPSIEQISIQISKKANSDLSYYGYKFKWIS